MPPETTQSQSWLGKILHAIGNFFSSAKPIVHDITVIADNVANAIKNSEASPTGLVHLTEVALEMAIPASIGLVNAFNLALPTIVKDLDWAVAEESKTGDQIVIDGLTYLASKKDTDQYVLELNNFAAKVQKWFSDNMGLGLTIQQCLLTPQIVHNPLLLGVANEVIADINTASKAVDTVVGDTQAAINSSTNPTVSPSSGSSTVNTPTNSMDGSAPTA